MDIVTQIVGVLTGIGLLGFLAFQLGKWLKGYVKSTETKIDDEALTGIINVGQRILDEKDLGELEKTLQKLLDGMKESEEETTEYEKEVEKGLEEIKKKQ